MVLQALPGLPALPEQTGPPDRRAPLVPQGRPEPQEQMEIPELPALQAQLVLRVLPDLLLPRQMQDIR